MLYLFYSLTYTVGTMRPLSHTVACFPFVVVFLIFGTTTPALAQSILKAADEYHKTLVLFERPSKSARQSVSLETVLRRGEAVTDHLDEFEFLNENDYERLQKSMRGYVLNREEVIFIRPKPDFFLSIARKHGSQADIDFFTLLLQIRPNAVWPIYIEQSNDYSGCTKYGSGELTDLYGKIIQYQRKFPEAYQEEIAEEKQEIVEAFSSEPCSCGDKASVIREFSLFVRRYPRDSNTPQIKRSLAEIRNREKYRDNCRPQ